MRAIWSGYISFGLISIPVGIYSAVEASEEVRFRLLHRKDHSPIKYKKFCSKEDVEVENDEIVKGFEVSKGKFAVVEKEELAEVKEKTAAGDHAIEILQFVDFVSINPLFIEAPYYLAPGKGGAKAYAVLRDALADSRRVGIARFTLRTRPLLAAMAPAERALSLAVLRAHEEVRSPDELAIPDASAKPAELKMAKMLVDQLSGSWDPTEHPNEYKQALEKLLAQKRSFALAAAPTKAGEAEVVDLMEALKRSVGQTHKAAPKKAAGRTAHHRAKKAGAA